MCRNDGPVLTGPKTEKTPEPGPPPSPPVKSPSADGLGPTKPPTAPREVCTYAILPSTVDPNPLHISPHACRLTPKVLCPSELGPLTSHSVPGIRPSPTSTYFPSSSSDPDHTPFTARRPEVSQGESCAIERGGMGLWGWFRSEYVWREGWWGSRMERQTVICPLCATLSVSVRIGHFYPGYPDHAIECGH